MNKMNTQKKKKPKPLSKQQEAVLAALEKSLGVITTACQAAGVSRGSVYKWIKENENFKDRFDSIKEVKMDFVESKLHALVNNGNPAAVIFAAKTLLKSRGYVEKQQVEVEHRGAVTVNIHLAEGTKL